MTSEGARIALEVADWRRRVAAIYAEVRSADELFANDLVITGADGRAQIRFTDGAIVSLQPRTEFRIDEYRFDAQAQRGVFTLLRGALRTALKGGASSRVSL